MLKKINIPVFLLLSLFTFGQTAHKLDQYDTLVTEIERNTTEKTDTLTAKKEQTDSKPNLNNLAKKKQKGSALILIKETDKKIVKRESLLSSTHEVDEYNKISQTLRAIATNPEKDVHANLFSKKTNTQKKKSRKIYWIKYEVNDGTTSNTSMKFVDKVLAKKLILKHNKELDTKIGKLNTLTIWEVYDSKAFIQHQVKNPEYINSNTSDFFNVDPYYTSLSKK